MRKGTHGSPRIPRIGALLLAAGMCGAASTASAQQGLVPDAIKARVNQLVKTCVDAGGRLGNMTGEGRFVLPYDFTGDGRTDFVVSEGNVPCTGRPDLFRAGGLSRVELHVATGSGTRLAFADRLLAYRVLAGPPAKLQVARRGSGCGPGSGERTRCGAELRWNAAANRFDEVETGREGGGRLPNPRPAVLDMGVVPMGAEPVVATAAGPAPSKPATALPSAASGDYTARCERETKAKYPDMSAASVQATCQEGWRAVQAALPIADALLAAAPVGPGGRPGLAALQSRLPQVRWAAPSADERRAGRLANGRMGELEVGVDGATTADALWFHWNEVAGAPPYDIAGALAARGATVTAMGCYHFGISEQNRVFNVQAPGRAPFSVASYDRGAPLASAIAHQTITLDLTGKVPTQASLRAEFRDPPWQAPCPF